LARKDTCEIPTAELRRRFQILITHEPTIFFQLLEYALFTPVTGAMRKPDGGRRQKIYNRLMTAMSCSATRLLSALRFVNAVAPVISFPQILLIQLIRYQFPRALKMQRLSRSGNARISEIALNALSARLIVLSGKQMRRF